LLDISITPTPPKNKGKKQGERNRREGKKKGGTLNSKKNRLKFISPHCKEIYPADTIKVRLVLSPKFGNNISAVVGVIH